MDDSLKDRTGTRGVNPLRQLSLEQLRQRTSMKWTTYQDDVLPLWVAEMDVPVAEPVARAIHSAVERGDTGYPAGTAYGEAFADFAARRWDWDDLAVERTAIVPDVMLGIVEMLKLVSGHGDPVVVNCPVYPPFYQFIRNDGRPVVEAPLTEEGRIDLTTLEVAFQKAAGHGGRPVYLLCSPHNPTGTVHTATELTDVAELARRYAVRVVADEIHAPIVAAGTSFVPYLSVSGAENSLSVMSASKAWNLAGLKAALAIMRPRGRRRPGPPARGSQSRPQPPRRHRPHRGPTGGRCLARQPAGRTGRKPSSARRSAVHPPARRALPPRPGHLPGLAGLPATGPWQRPGGRLPGTRPDRPQLRDGLRAGRSGVCPYEPGHLPGNPRRRGPQDGLRTVSSSTRKGRDG